MAPGEPATAPSRSARGFGEVWGTAESSSEGWQRVGWSDLRRDAAGGFVVERLVQPRVDRDDVFDLFVTQRRVERQHRPGAQADERYERDTPRLQYVTASLTSSPAPIGYESISCERRRDGCHRDRRGPSAWQQALLRHLGGPVEPRAAWTTAGDAPLLRKIIARFRWFCGRVVMTANRSMGPKRTASCTSSVSPTRRVVELHNVGHATASPAVGANSESNQSHTRLMIFVGMTASSASVSRRFVVPSSRSTVTGRSVDATSAASDVGSVRCMTNVGVCTSSRSRRRGSSTTACRCRRRCRQRRHRCRRL